MPNGRLYNRRRRSGNWRKKSKSARNRMAIRKRQAYRRNTLYYRRRRPVRRRRTAILKLLNQTPYKLCKIRYATNFIFDAGANQFYTLSFTCAGTYDPDYWGTGHQPQGRDYLFTQYQKMAIVRSDAMMQYDTAAQTTVEGRIGSMFGIHVGPPTATTNPVNPMSFGGVVGNFAAHTAPNSHATIAYPTGVARWGQLYEQNAFKRLGGNGYQVTDRSYGAKQNFVRATATYKAKQYWGLGAQKITRVDGLEERDGAAPTFTDLDNDRSTPVFTFWTTGLHGTDAGANNFTIIIDYTCIAFEPIFTAVN